MRQRIIAVASTVAGLAVMALVVSLQQNPLLWTHATPHVSPTTPASAAPPEDNSTTKPAPPASSVDVITLPPIRVTAAKPTAPAEQKLDGDSLEPCSEWRDIGPTYVEEGQPQGTQRVRTLC